MKLEDQVCSLELAKRLRALGVKQDSLFYYPWSRPDVVRPMRDEPTGEWVSAFTVAELAEALAVRKDFFIDKLKGVLWRAGFLTAFSSSCPILANAMGEALITAIENKLVTPKETTPND